MYNHPMQPIHKPVPLTSVLIFQAILMTFCINPKAFAQAPLVGGVHQQRMIQAAPKVKGIVGFELAIRAHDPNRPPIIIDVFPGTPAEKMDLQVGDEVLEADHRPLHGLDAPTVDRAISDVPGHRILFMIRRNQRIIYKTLEVSVPKRTHKTLFY